MHLSMKGQGVWLAFSLAFFSGEVPVGPRGGAPTVTFKFSADPELEAKIRDVVGLYLTTRARGWDRCRELPRRRRTGMSLHWRPSSCGP
jgi:hypothetical protein